jgi:hypothetical protein
MTNKKNNPYLSLYPEDFVGTVWNEVCDVLKINPASREVRIYFEHGVGVVAELPEDDDKYATLF